MFFPSICIGDDVVADSHATATTTSATNISADLFIYQFVSPVHDNHNQSQLGKNWLMLVEEGFDDRCTKLTYDPVTNSDKLVDIICHRGKFYAVAENGRAIVIDPSSSLPEPVTIADPVSDGVYARMMKLIESSGELLLVETRPVFNSFPAKVFKLNTYEKRWVKIEHLKGRQVLFVTLWVMSGASLCLLGNIRASCTIAFTIMIQYRNQYHH
ncbi:hypothetical protein ACLB2K_074893 [Fragaria x ananassa]